MSHSDADTSHDPGHSPALPGNNVAFAIGVTLNLGFVAVEVIYGLAAQSLALLSDAGHNLSDVLALLLAWGAGRIAKAMPTKRRTYGWRRSSILAALINAVVLLLVVGGIIWEAIERLVHVQPVATGTVIGVAAAGVVINTVSALLFMGGRKGDINIRSAYAHLMADAAVSLGVVLTGFAMQFTGWLWIDPAASMAIGVVIIIGTWGLLYESINLTMDAVPAGIDPHAVETWLSQLPGVAAVHDLHIWAMSTTETALTVHLVMRPAPPSDDFLHTLTHDLHRHFGIGHVTTQIEHGDLDRECHQAPAHVV